MKYHEFHEKLNQIQKLVSISNTGSPKDLAKTLNVSERTARRLVQKLKQQKMPIEYCRKSNSYIFKNTTK